MTTTTTDSDRPVPPAPLASDPGSVIAETERFLDQCQSVGVHPDDVAGELVRAGWQPGTAGLVADRYRARFDEHRLGYAGFLFGVGFSALAAGSIGHLLLAWAEHGEPARETLALWLTVLVIAVPFAIWSWSWVRQVDATDPVAGWSRPRQSLARTLLWCCGIIGGFRLLHYVFTFISTLTGASWAGDRNLLVGLANVGVTAGITVPLGIWAFRFLHKFER
jgi:hypothetical protein